jgi:hypothetical protein
MADTTLASLTPESTPESTPRRSMELSSASTLSRVGAAWSALGRRRRILVAAGVALVTGIAITSTTVVPLASAVALALVGGLAGAAAVVDQHEQRLPNALVAASLCIVGAAAVLDGAWTTVDVVISMAMASFPLWAVRYGKGLALGDVKFAAVLGAAAGLVHPFAGLVVVWSAAVASGVFALATRRNRLVLGPWLWAGYAAAGSAAIALVRMLEMGGHTWPARP